MDTPSLPFAITVASGEQPDPQNGRPEVRIQQALALLTTYGVIDGAHHKQWCIDQTVRLLAGFYYPAVIAAYRSGEDGPDTYDWDEGIAP